MTTEHTNTQENKEIDGIASSILETLCMARDRLNENNRGRAAIQEKLSCKCGRIENMINEMRERLLTEVSTTEKKDTEMLLSLISDGDDLLVSDEIADNNKLQSFIKKATAALQNVKCYKITEAKLYEAEGGPKNILSIEAVVKPREFKVCPCDISNTKKAVEVIEGILKELDEAATVLHERCMSTAEEVERRCDEIICSLNNLQEQINRELKVAYEAEDERIQKLVHGLSN